MIAIVSSSSFRTQRSGSPEEAGLNDSRVAIVRAYAIAASSSSKSMAVGDSSLSAIRADRPQRGFGLACSDQPDVVLSSDFLYGRHLAIEGGSRPGHGCDFD